MLGSLSFWLGSAPCGCRRAYCGPHWDRESARVIASLLGSSPTGVRRLSRLILSLRPSRSRSPFPSLAPSWWSPCPLMRRALLTLYGYVLGGPSVFSLHRSCFRSRSQYSPSRAVSSLTYQSFACDSFCGGASPHVGFRQSPWGSRWLHLYHLTPALVSLRDFAVHHLELRSVFHAFTARRSACILGDNFVSFADLGVSQPEQSYRVVIFGHLK